MNRYFKSVLCVAFLVLAWATDHYHSKASEWRSVARSSQQRAEQQTAIITDMKRRQQQLAILDKTHTEALRVAQNQIDDLQRNVVAGNQRLRIHANCPALRAGRSPGTTRVDDAASARPTDAAQRNYFILRKRIETARHQIAGLQQYIREQCMGLRG